jgi:hypothetical protein
MVCGTVSVLVRSSSQTSGSEEKKKKQLTSLEEAVKVIGSNQM